jgi:hypothetical protein
MKPKKEKALKLRLSGKSYREIHLALGVPKSTLSSWLSRIQLSDRVIRSIYAKSHKHSMDALLKRNKNQTKIADQKRIETKKAAAQEIGKIDLVQLKILGSALYWAEGYKRQKIRDGRLVNYHAVSLTNSDPDLVKLFLLFLREVCEVPESRIRASVRYFSHQNSNHLLHFWQNVTGLPISNFGQPLLSVNNSSRGIRPYNQLPHGTIQIRVSDTVLFYRIMGWIEGLRKLK